MDEPEILLDHLFRRQAGRMVSHLARLLGPTHLNLAEEAVQDAMLRALSSWPYDGVPQNPEGSCCGSRAMPLLTPSGAGGWPNQKSVS